VVVIMIMVALAIGMIMVLASVIVIMYLAGLAVYRFREEGNRPQSHDSNDRDPAPEDVAVERILKDVLKQVAIPQHDGDCAEQTADRERQDLFQVIRGPIVDVRM